MLCIVPDVAGLHGVSLSRRCSWGTSCGHRAGVVVHGAWWPRVINGDVLYNRAYVAAVPHSRLWSSVHC
jgi:hypothetical protein